MLPRRCGTYCLLREYKVTKNMRKSELFARILADVAEETELSASDILSNRKTFEVVDARYLLVYLLVYFRFYRSEIARYLHITPQAVGRIFSGFDSRCKQSRFLESNLNRILTKLERN